MKSVRGQGRGWLRADLGGNHGHQFYLWWARPGAVPVRDLGLGRDEVLVRAVRHHDETDRALDPGTPADWLPLDATELPAYALVPELLPVQADVVASRARTRLIQGQPGTGKTTVLWRAALASGDHHVLYVTHSTRLAARAEEFFRQFAPSGITVRVTTFSDLVTGLAAATGATELPPGGPPERPSDRLGEALMGYGQRYVPWEGRLDDLYAELHGHFVGAALPVPLRGAPACAGPVFEGEAYVTRRREVLGEKPARVAARLGAYLYAQGSLRDLVPGPWRARGVLDALRAGATLPNALTRVDAVFVDEIQDLTVVEAALLVDLVARIAAARGDAPACVLAGDEGQTVRPTDFDWGVLADLVGTRLGGAVTHELAGNVRSPRNIAAVVNRSWDLYRTLARDLRPRGRSTTDIEEVVPGRIIRCRVRTDDELHRIAEAFQALPGAAFVYPGGRVPVEYTSPAFEAFTSDEAKGLDFAVVGVLDAGRRLVDLRRRAATGREDRLDGLQARTLADQLRVALSRATETLVFLDRGEATEADAEVDRLCRDEAGEFLDGCLREMSPDDLVALLAREDATAEELVGEFLHDVRSRLHEAPRRALDRARRARGLLGRADSRCGVADLSLRGETHRWLGAAALYAALHPGTDAGARRDLLSEANRALHLAQRPAAARAALHARDLLAAPSQAADDALALLGDLEAVEAEAPELARPLRNALIAWCAGLPDHAPPGGIAARLKLAAAADAVADRFAAETPGLHDRAVALRVNIVHALRADGHPRPALDLLLAMKDPPAGELARCHEDLGNHAMAADLHELVGDRPAALRCIRRTADFDRAHRLAEALGAPEARVLSWARTLRDLLTGAGVTAVDLGEEEKQALRALADTVLPPRARPGRRVSIPPG